MKIGLVTGEFPPMEGGVGAFTQELARALAEQAHEVHIITSREARPTDPDIKVSRTREPIDIGFAQLHPWIGRWRWPSLQQIVSVVIRHELDVLNIQYQAAAYNMRSGTINFLPWRLKAVLPTIVTFHDLRVPYLFPKAGFLRETAVTRMARTAKGIIVTNKADFDAITNRVSTPTVQIPIGSNIRAATPNHIEIAAAREDSGVGEDDILLGYFGFLNASKGADVLLQALAELDGRFSLVFIGGQTGASDATNAGYLAKMQTLVVELGLTERVHWTGFISDARVAAFLHASDIMVMPYQDGVSLRRGTLMAALANGRPLISTQPTTPTPELQNGENCWLIPPNDVDEVVQAIKTLAADPKLRTKLGQGAAEMASLFTWDKIAAQTVDFYNQVRTA